MKKGKSEEEKVKVKKESEKVKRLYCALTEELSVICDYSCVISPSQNSSMIGRASAGVVPSEEPF